MIDHTMIRYCLACHKPMRDAGPVCEFCGADQEETRARLLEPPPPRTGLAALRKPPPLPLNAVEPVACPSCRVPVPAGAPSCAYCGHPMATDLPHWKSDARCAGTYLIWTLVCLAAALILCATGFFLIALPVYSIAAVLAFFGYAENPFGWSGAVVAGITVGSFILGIVLAAFR